MKKGFKAFDKGFICKGKQYKEGEIFEENITPELCKKGIHYCENPFDLLDFYDLTNCEFSEIEDLGDTKSDGKKSCTNKIKIGLKLDLKMWIRASFDFVWEKCKNEGYSSQQASSGYSSQQASSGDSSQQASSGDYSKQASSGYSSKQASSGYSSQQASSGYSSQQASSGDETEHEVNGKNGVSAAIGKKSKIKGIIGTWITLAEYDKKGICICVKSQQIDGVALKENVFYQLINEDFTEV